MCTYEYYIYVSKVSLLSRVGKKADLIAIVYSSLLQLAECLQVMYTL